MGKYKNARIHSISEIILAPSGGESDNFQLIASALMINELCFLKLDSVREDEGGIIWENGIETCILSYVKRIASPGSMHETGCSGLVHWDDPEGWDGEGGGREVRIQNTCIPMADSSQSMTKPLQYCKVISLQLK